MNVICEIVDIHGYSDVLFDCEGILQKKKAKIRDRNYERQGFITWEDKLVHDWSLGEHLVGLVDLLPAAIECTVTNQ